MSSKKTQSCLPFMICYGSLKLNINLGKMQSKGLHLPKANFWK